MAEKQPIERDSQELVQQEAQTRAQARALVQAVAWARARAQTPELARAPELAPERTLEAVGCSALFGPDEERGGHLFPPLLVTHRVYGCVMIKSGTTR